ncbi:outer dense fiber protein 2 [Clonorchis sinensis]|uniref:Outer dense fiber protein 2 n=1 Tax=Clonorchis sinensis TaxID=79923 RepID=G7Y6E7_CLOSI|nr:outer dense fiber protein 2 [Clonorchis sinensis]
MTKGVVKVEHKNLSTSQSPIHLHVSEDAPVHLHFEPPGYCGSEQVKQAPEFRKYPVKSHSPYQVPWIPPPAKTSKGKFAYATRPATRKVNVMCPRRSTSADSIIHHPEDPLEDSILRGATSYDERNELPETDRKLCASRQSIEPVRETRPVRFAGELSQKCVHNNENIDLDGMEDEALWTTSVMEQWANDVENAIAHVARAARSVEQYLDEIMAEGRQVTTRDMNRLNQPKDDLVLHGEVAVRAGRELCRWASSVKQQQDRFLNRKLQNVSSRENAMQSEIHRLKESLDRTTLELEETQKRLGSQQNESARFTSVTESLETVRAHLQRELRQRESECNRLSTQVRGLECRLAEERATLHTRLESSVATVAQLSETKEALKRAARAQKKRADQAEKSLKDLLERLGKTDGRITPGEEIVDRRYAGEDDEHGGGQVGDGASRSYSPSSASKQRTPRENLTRRASSRDVHLEKLQEENQHLRDIAAKCERRMATAEHEMEELRTSLMQCESMLHDQQRDADAQAHKLRVLTEQLQVQKTGRDEREKSPTYQRETQLVEELRRQLAEARNEREQVEHAAEIRSAELRAQLTQADATNRSLQAYLTFLKRSYASVFQPDLAQLLGSSKNGVNCNLFKGQNTLETSDMSPGLSPQAVTREQHR